MAQQLDLFKLPGQTVYYKESQNNIIECKCVEVVIRKSGIAILLNTGIMRFRLLNTDYGNIWALSKEELL